jgi:hypothetical protein
MDYIDAYILGASALIGVLPSDAPADPNERIKLASLLVEQAKESLGGRDVHDHDEWLSICEGISSVGEQWIETGNVSEGAPVE